MINNTLESNLSLDNFDLSNSSEKKKLKKDFLNHSFKFKESLVENNLSNDVHLERIKEAFSDFDKKESIDKMHQSIDIDGEALKFFNEHVELDSYKSLVVARNEKLTSYSNLNKIENILLLNKMNNFRKINKYFEQINEQLSDGACLLGSFETFRERMKRNKINSAPYIGKIYAGYEFVFKRVIPKLPYFKNVYFSITKGRDRLLSKAEALGRLVSCGFEIIDVREINGIHYYVAKKVKSPDYNMNPSYGPLFKMNRVGKNGKLIGVYKFRTMHPYSEYLQDYIVKNNGYSETGKPANDFRVVPWAKVLRRYWIDELPQLINVLKGEMKLVGIRPVSKSYFDSSVPKDIQDLRLTQKPGCIPPYVALNRRSSVESVLEAEREYLMEKIKNPYFTDTKFFFKAIYNIVFKRKRSA